MRKAAEAHSMKYDRQEESAARPMASMLGMRKGNAAPQSEEGHPSHVRALQDEEFSEDEIRIRGRPIGAASFGAS
jgi:hypothetical protein